MGYGAQIKRVSYLRDDQGNRLRFQVGEYENSLGYDLKAQLVLFLAGQNNVRQSCVHLSRSAASSMKAATVHPASAMALVTSSPLNWIRISTQILSTGISVILQTAAADLKAKSRSLPLWVLRPVIRILSIRPSWGCSKRSTHTSSGPRRLKRKYWAMVLATFSSGRRACNRSGSKSDPSRSARRVEKMLTPLHSS